MCILREKMQDCHTSPCSSALAKGKVYMLEDGGVPVNVFMGIPYAEAPVGDLRFCPPVPRTLWTGERDCTQFGESNEKQLYLI